jgi:DNA polymerase III subunit delta'
MYQFSDIVGQDEVKSSLIAQVKSGKLHHAHLFIGKMGYGTLQLAMAFLKYVYCHQPTDIDSCDTCPNCTKVNKLEHIDIHFTLPSFDAKKLSNVIFSEFRAIMEQENGLFDLKDWHDFNKEKNSKIRAAECDIILNTMSLSSYEDGYKTQIIWMAESLEKESNKILKILEEPSPKTIFLLIAESSDMLLPTIISRCNIQKVLPLQNDVVKSYLKSKVEGKSNEELDRAVTFSGGDLIEATRYLDDEESDFPLEVNLLNFLRGLINFGERKFSNINKALIQADIIATQSMSTQRKFLDYFQYFLSQVILVKITGECQLNTGLKQAAVHFASALDIDQIESWSEIIDKNYHALEGNANVKISFVSLAIESGQIQTRNEYEVLVNK